MAATRRTVLTGTAAAAGLAVATGGTARASDARRGTSTPTKEVFGELPDGTEVYRWSLENGGIRMGVLSYGGIVQSLEVPDRHGRRANVSLGSDNLADYLSATTFFGALIGRYGNRIARGRFTLDGKTYQLSVNDGENSLHGGAQGFDKRIWDIEGFNGPLGVGLILRYTSADGEMGYPGTLRATVTYTLSAHGDWRIDYEARTDKPTVVNLTSHVYYNLSGEGSGSILDHELALDAGRYTPVGAGLIPTGEIAPVSGTPFDFRRGKPIGQDIRTAHPQLLPGLGYDHNWVLDKGITHSPRHAVTLRDPASGRVMRVATTEPGVQFYAGNQLNGSLVGPLGRTYRQSDGLALETQHFPDSPNQPGFPSTVLRPGETYRSSTVYSFGS
jgi:aldose 1-epimerase